MSKKERTKEKRASSDQPLSGERVLVTRAQGQAEKLSSALRDAGAAVVEVPVIEIRPPDSFAGLDAALRQIDAYDWLILTSVNGVRALFSRLEQLGMGMESLLHLSVAAIGPATETEMEKHGVPVDVVPEEYVAESVVEALREQVKGKRVMLVRAKVARDVIPMELRKEGATVHVFEAYQTIAPESSRAELKRALTGPDKPTAITFTSSSTARNFLDLLGDLDRHVLDGITLASIGPVTSATLREIGLRVDVEAREFSIPGLVEALSGNLRS